MPKFASYRTISSTGTAAKRVYQSQPTAYSTPTYNNTPTSSDPAYCMTKSDGTTQCFNDAGPVPSTY
jgi:hypothetical protein